MGLCNWKANREEGSQVWSVAAMGRTERKKHNGSVRCESRLTAESKSEAIKKFQVWYGMVYYIIFFPLVVSVIKKVISVVMKGRQKVVKCLQFDHQKVFTCRHLSRQKIFKCRHLSRQFVVRVVTWIVVRSSLG